MLQKVVSSCIIGILGILDMIKTCIISLITFLALTVSILLFPSLKIGGKKTGTYWIVAVLGALALLAFGCVPPAEVAGSLISNTAINPLKILVLFFSMTFISVLLDEVGFFRYLANRAVKVAGNNQFLLFITLYFTVAALTVFTSNDIMILTLTPFICFFCKNAKIDPLPFLVSEFAAANTWSMMFIIGNPTNIYLATFAGIGFAEYFKTMLLPTLAAGVLEFLLIILIFYKRLKKPLKPSGDGFKIKEKAELIAGIIHLVLCLLALVISDHIGAQMWIITAVCAVSLLISVTVIKMIKREGIRCLSRSLIRLPWQLIPFIISMFTVVIALNYRGVSAQLGEYLGNTHCVLKYGVSSFIMSNIINNIPMSILFSALPNSLTGRLYYEAIYSSVIGSNIGAFLTPIGALAGIMFTGLTERHGVKYGFKEFIGYGALISVPTIAAALFTLSLVI